MTSFQLDVVRVVHKLEATLEGFVPPSQPDGSGEALRHLNITKLYHHQPPGSTTVTYPTDLGMEAHKEEEGGEDLHICEV